MNSEAFLEGCKMIIKFIIDHKENRTGLKITNDIYPGEISSKLEKTPIDFKHNSKNKSKDISKDTSKDISKDKWKDKSKDRFEEIFNKFKTDIYPYILNWQSPMFLGYFPSCNSYPSILGELLSAGLGIIGFSWSSCPSSTELEMYCINEFIRLMRLPYTNGVILSSSSESILISLIISINMKKENIGRLVCYTSELAHSCISKAANLTNTKIQRIETNKKYEIDIEKLEEMIKLDIKNGLVPCYIMGTFGTTSVCSVDNIEELGKLSRKYKIYLHVDGAYSGGTLMMRKYRKMIRGIMNVDSININCNKLLLINYDCTLMFYKTSVNILEALSIDPVYLSSEFNKLDMRNYDISLSRRFRSLKVWFTLQMYGVKGINQYIKKQFKMARYIGWLIKRYEPRLEIINKIQFGLVCIRICNSNGLTEKLYEEIINRKEIYATNSKIKNKYIIRLSMNNIKSSNEIRQIFEYIVGLIDMLMGKKDVDEYKYLERKKSIIVNEDVIMNRLKKFKLNNNIGMHRKRSISCTSMMGICKK